MTIKVRLLLTIGGIILLSIAVLGAYTYRNQIGQLERGFRDLARNEHRLFETVLGEDAEGLDLALDGLRRQEALLGPFAERDREALLEAVLPVFQTLRSEHAITHLYFILPDGTVFLRAHKPDEHGDRLQRATFRQAAASRSTASGIEMGKNFFSLRCVSPVFSREGLIGYMEAGEEIDHIFEQMKAITGNEFSILLPGSYLERHDAEWPALRTGDLAILYPTRPETTIELVRRNDLIVRQSFNGFRVGMMDSAGKRYVIGGGPIRDAFGETAGALFSFREITPIYDAIGQGLAFSLAVFLLILAAGNLLLFLSLRKSIDLFNALRRHIQEVSRSWKLGPPLQVTTTDEIGELTADLNRMEAEIGKLHATLEERADALAVANRDLESFSYSLSHDLRLPLTRIYTAGEMLRDSYGERLDETGRLLIDHVCKGSEGMEELIEAILALTRITRKELLRETVDLGAIARQVAAELDLSEPDRQVEWVIGQGLHAMGDPQLIRVALTNLLGNAWKYTRPVENPKVEFGAIEQDGQRIFFVRDNGVGFDMKDADQLFAPFKRLHQGDGIPGMGIGLATVKRIIQRHGGTIRANGAPGKGATFYFSLP